MAVVAASPRSLPVLMCSIDGGMVPNQAGDHVGHGRVPAGPIGGQGGRRAPPDIRDDRATALILMPRTLTPEWCNLSLSCAKASSIHS